VACISIQGSVLRGCSSIDGSAPVRALGGMSIRTEGRPDHHLVNISKRGKLQVCCEFLSGAIILCKASVVASRLMIHQRRPTIGLLFQAPR